MPLAEGAILTEEDLEFAGCDERTFFEVGFDDDPSEAAQRRGCAFLHRLIDEQKVMALLHLEDRSAEGEAVDGSADAEAVSSGLGAKGIEGKPDDGPVEGGTVQFEETLELLRSHEAEDSGKGGRGGSPFGEVSL